MIINKPFFFKKKEITITLEKKPLEWRNWVKKGKKKAWANLN